MVSFEANKTFVIVANLDILKIDPWSPELSLHVAVLQSVAVRFYEEVVRPFFQPVPLYDFISRLNTDL